MMAPQLITFDIFGTVLDWRRGLTANLAARGCAISTTDFDRVIDRQGALEQLRPLRSYRDITAATCCASLSTTRSTRRRQRLPSSPARD
jgi:FMN phosphatase YigB (HAD superfamily)